MFHAQVNELQWSVDRRFLASAFVVDCCSGDVEKNWKNALSFPPPPPDIIKLSSERYEPLIHTAGIRHDNYLYYGVNNSAQAAWRSRGSFLLLLPQIHISIYINIYIFITCTIWGRKKFGEQPRSLAWLCRMRTAWRRKPRHHGAGEKFAEHTWSIRSRVKNGVSHHTFTHQGPPKRNEVEERERAWSGVGCNNC